jgi:hypothetical protein
VLILLLLPPLLTLLPSMPPIATRIAVLPRPLILRQEVWLLQLRLLRLLTPSWCGPSSQRAAHTKHWRAHVIRWDRICSHYAKLDVRMSTAVGMRPTSSATDT